MKALSLLITFLITTLLSFGQKLDSLKLNAQEVPHEYSSLDKPQCKSIQATLLYNNPDMYSAVLGEVISKGFQTFKSKKDSGSILYFEFEKEITMAPFLSGLLWGENGKPTKSHPEEYEVKGNILIIWSFDKDSPIKSVSKEKVLKLL